MDYEKDTPRKCKKQPTDSQKSTTSTNAGYAVDSDSSIDFATTTSSSRRITNTLLNAPQQKKQQQYVTKSSSATAQSTKQRGPTVVNFDCSAHTSSGMGVKNLTKMRLPAAAAVAANGGKKMPSRAPSIKKCGRTGVSSSAAS